MLTIRSRLIGSIASLAAILVADPIRGEARQEQVPQVETVEIPIGLLPFDLQGLMRRPEGPRRRTAGVVLLSACSQPPKALDEDWGAKISSWGYATLTVDGFGPRGIKNCASPWETDLRDLPVDAYRALDFLIQRGLVDPARVAVVGFARGAWQALSATERGEIEKASGHKFRGVAAFYPQCQILKGLMTVPTLILIGGHDSSADACRKLVAGEDDFGISRKKGEGAAVRLIVYPGAFRGFDVPALQTPREFAGHHLEYNKTAADQSSDALRDFLKQTLGERP